MRGEKNKRSSIGSTAVFAVLILLMSMLSGCGRPEVGGTLPAGEGDAAKAFDDSRQVADSSQTVVDNTADLMNAIEPGADIFLKAGSYDFFEWYEGLDDPDAWLAEHPCISLDFASSTVEVGIWDISGLRITGEHTSEVRLLTPDRYACVLSFNNCEDISLSHLTAGHETESGKCAGAVLSFTGCTSVLLGNMDLYGCGTYGITAWNSTELSMENSLIRDCSEGILSTVYCSGFDFRNCSFEDCAGLTDQLYSYGSELLFDSCRFEGGGEKDGEVSFLPEESLSSVYFSKCSFGEWESSQIRSKSRRGNAVYDEYCTFAGEADARPVVVSSAEELLDAIAPNRVIILEPGVYNLSEYIGSADFDMQEFNGAHQYVQAEDCFDGAEIVISASELTISGRPGQREETLIVTEPRYADVVHLRGCSNISFRGLTMGHTQTGECAGDVVGIESGKGFVFADTELYGCGVKGICAQDAEEIGVYGSVIRDCSEGSLDFMGCGGTRAFIGTVLDGSGCYLGSDTDAIGIAFVKCTFGEWESNFFYFRDDLWIQDCEWSEITSYPEMPDIEGDFRSYQSIQPFEGYDIYGDWTCVWMSSPDGSTDTPMPSYSDDGELEAWLNVSGDGSGYFAMTAGEPQRFTWKMDSGHEIVALNPNGTEFGRLNVMQADIPSGDAPVYLFLLTDFGNYWFARSAG